MFAIIYLIIGIFYVNLANHKAVHNGRQKYNFITDLLIILIWPVLFITHVFF